MIARQPAALLIAFAVLIVAVSVAYYFFWYLPKLNDAKLIADRDAQLQKNQQACSAQEQKVLDQYLEENPTRPRSSLSTQNHFNTAKNKCFVTIADLYANSSVAFTSFSLYDASENRVVAWVRFPLQSGH